MFEREPLSRPLPEEINPYASPAEAGGYDDRQPFGVGVWRDGGLLVMHQNAELPRFCVHTGEPAVGGREYVLIWKYPGSVFTSSKAVLIPLCRKCIREFLRLRAQSFVGLGLAVLGLLLMFAASTLEEWGFVAVVGTLVFGGFGVLLWLHAYWTLGRPLSVVHAQGDYLWLQDVHPGLLQHVPVWPPSGSAGITGRSNPSNPTRGDSL